MLKYEASHTVMLVYLSVIRQLSYNNVTIESGVERMQLPNSRNQVMAI
jgi:hypothetical protein